MFPHRRVGLENREFAGDCVIMTTKHQIGAGVRAAVYLDNDHAIKLYNADCDKTWVFHEAYNMVSLEGSGIPLPKVYEVVHIRGQYGIRMDYAAGETVAGLALSGAISSADYIGILTDVQMKLLSASASLPFNVSDILSQKLHSSDLLTQAEKDALLSKLAALPRGNAVCHGDLHGQNIIKTADDYCVVDWYDATSGNPHADICRSYMLHYFYSPDLASAYLDAICAKAKATHADIMQWLPIVFACRMSEGFPQEHATIKQWLTQYSQYIPETRLTV